MTSPGMRFRVYPWSRKGSRRAHPRFSGTPLTRREGEKTLKSGRSPNEGIHEIAAPRLALVLAASSFNGCGQCLCPLAGQIILIDLTGARYLSQNSPSLRTLVRRRRRH